MATVTDIWGGEVTAIITVGAEVAGITMDGHVAGISDSIRPREMLKAGNLGSPGAFRRRIAPHRQRFPALIEA
jgi:hypothetical protein